MTGQMVMARLASAVGNALFLGGLLVLLVMSMLVLLGALGGLPTGQGYIGVLHWQGFLILAAGIGAGALLRRAGRRRPNPRS